MISNLASISATCHYDVAEPERLQLLCKYVGLYRPSTLVDRTMEGEEKGGVNSCHDAKPRSRRIISLLRSDL